MKASRLFLIAAIAFFVLSFGMGVRLASGHAAGAAPDGAFAAIGVGQVLHADRGSARIRLRSPEEVAPGAERLIRFDVSEGMRQQLSERELAEQMRDWLFFTVLAENAPSDEALRDAMFDAPVVRYGYMEGAARFEYGPTRVRALPDGRAVAIAPATSDPRQRADYLGHAADAVQTDAGQAFSELIVYSYTFDLASGEAHLTREAPIPYATLFSAEYGYFERTIAARADLETLLNQIDDITVVRRTDAGLTLGGRKLQARSHGRVNISDVAALYQSERDIAVANREFEAWQRNLEARLNREINAYTLTEPEARRQFEEESVAEQYRRHIVDGSGFSLDPSYDYEGIASGLAQFAQIQWDGAPEARLTRIYDYLRQVCPRVPDEDARYGAIMLAQVQFPPLTGVAEAQAGVAQRDIVPLLQVMDRMGAPGDGLDPRLGLLDCLVQARQHQSARYDGPLAGTEVGMTLFYTDLLAKMWAINYQNASPLTSVPGFVNLYSQRIEAIFQAEGAALPSARLWFGHNENGFGLGVDGQSLYMARNATRIYAAGSNPLFPGRETQTSRLMGAPMAWWNDHYEEVGAYEPQYQRLNEIMKWSLVLGWLNNASAGDSLSFLGDVEVARDNWFPQWVRAHPELRFRSWEAVPFFQRGFLGTETETMPLLSTTGQDAYDPRLVSGFQGGVSLAPRRAFAARSAPRELGVGARRAAIDYQGASGASARLMDGAEFAFEGPTRVVARAGSEARLQGVGVQMVNAPVARTYSASGAPSVRVALGEADVGVLRMGRSSDNAFTVGFERRQLDVTYDVVRRGSRSNAPIDQALASDPNVAMVLKAGDRHFVRVNRSTQWSEVARDDIAEMAVPDGWTARVSEFGAAQPLRFRIVPESEVLSAFGERVVFSQRGQAIVGTGSEAAAAGRPVQVQIGGQNVPVRVNAQGDVVVSMAEVPVEIRADLLQQLSTGNVQRIAAAAQGETVGLNGARVTRAVADGDAAAVARLASGESRAALAPTYREGVARADALLRNNDATSALLELDGLARIFGNTPDIALRRALARLNQGRTADAVDALRTQNGRVLLEPQRLVEELSARASSSARRGDYDRLRQLAEHQRSPRDVGMSGYRTPNGELGLEMRVVDFRRAQQATPEQLQRAVDDGATVFVERGPNLAEIDLSAPINDVVRQALAMDGRTILRLPVGDSMSFRPSQLYASQSRETFALARGQAAPRAGTATAPSPAGAAAQGTRTGTRGGECSSEQDADCQNNQGYVYVIRAA